MIFEFIWGEIVWEFRYEENVKTKIQNKTQRNGGASSTAAIKYGQSNVILSWYVHIVCVCVWHMCMYFMWCKSSIVSRLILNSPKIAHTRLFILHSLPHGHQLFGVCCFCYSLARVFFCVSFLFSTKKLYQMPYLLFKRDGKHFTSFDKFYEDLHTQLRSTILVRRRRWFAI